MNARPYTRPRTMWSALIDRLGAPSARDGAEVRPITPTPMAHHNHWHWLFADEVGVAVPAAPYWFLSQNAAEDWLETSFDSLLRLGISAVTLLDGEHAVYGPVRLRTTPEAA